MSDSLNLDLEESIKSSEGSGSGAQGNTISVQAVQGKREVIEFSNRSIMHGYDMALELLMLHKEEQAVKILSENRAFIEFQLTSTIDERVKMAEAGQ